jgi:hypothetical protein
VDLRKDESGLFGMSFETPLVSVGYVLIVLASAAVLFHNQGWFQGLLWPDMFNLSPLFVGGGVMLILSNWTFDYRWMVLAGFIVAIGWYILMW